MKKTPLAIFACLLAALSCSGCRARYDSAVVKQNPFRAQITSDLTADWLTKYRNMSEATDADRAAKRVRRNQILNEFVWLADDAYYQWEPKFYNSGAAIQTFFEFASFGLTAAVPVANGPKVLGAMSTGIQSANASVSKNFYDQQSRSVIVQKMRQLREAALVRIADGENKDVVNDDPTETYSIEQGIVDIQNYYYAGTVTAALQGLATSTAEKSNQDKDALEKVRTGNAPAAVAPDIRTAPTQPPNSAAPPRVIR